MTADIIGKFTREPPTPPPPPRRTMADRKLAALRVLVKNDLPEEEINSLFDAVMQGFMRPKSLEGGATWRPTSSTFARRPPTPEAAQSAVRVLCRAFGRNVMRQSPDECIRLADIIEKMGRESDPPPAG